MKDQTLMLPVTSSDDERMKMFQLPTGPLALALIGISAALQPAIAEQACIREVRAESPAAREARARRSLILARTDN